MAKNTEVFATKPEAPSKDDRPDVVQTKHKRLAVAGKHDDAVPYTDEDGKLCAFKHKDTGAYYQYNAAFASDPAFIATYMSKDELILKVVG